jgi:hypothetical protein
MIARGDLSTAVGDDLPRVQAHIAARARARGKPFIVASNLLSAMQDGSARVASSRPCATSPADGYGAGQLRSSS